MHTRTHQGENRKKRKSKQSSVSLSLRYRCCACRNPAERAPESGRRLLVASRGDRSISVTRPEVGTDIAQCRVCSSRARPHHVLHVIFTLIPFGFLSSFLLSFIRLLISTKLHSFPLSHSLNSLSPIAFSLSLSLSHSLFLSAAANHIYSSISQVGAEFQRSRRCTVRCSIECSIVAPTVISNSIFQPEHLKEGSSKTKS